MAQTIFKATVRLVGAYARTVAAYKADEVYSFTFPAATREQAVTIAKQKMRSVLLVNEQQLPASHIAVRFTHG